MTRFDELQIVTPIYKKGLKGIIPMVSNVPKHRIMESGYANKFKKNDKK